jgi:hypothetical protein
MKKNELNKDWLAGKNPQKKKKYAFDKKNHFHSLDGTPLYGVTTALRVIAKPFLIPWASKMATDSIRSQWKIGKAYTKIEREKILEKGKNAHHVAKTSGGDTGTTVHEAIEKWIKKGCSFTDKIEKYCGKDMQVQDMFMNFVAWVNSDEVKFVCSEKHVHSEKYWYGGIVDFVCIIKGKRFVGDIKTSSGIYPEHFMQMGAYDICLQEMGEPKADGYIIVNLQKNGTIRIKKFTSTKKFQEAFIHALNLYKALKDKELNWNPNY